jgi:GPI mannosyltransferase 3
VTTLRASTLSILGISVVGFILRLNESLRISSLAHPDEVFQTLEPAHRLAFGYGIITWEWREGIRSWVFPVFIAGVMKCTDWLGKGSTGYLISIRVLLSALSLTTIWFGFVWAKRTSGNAAAVISAAACAIWYELIGFAPRAMPEVVATDVLLVGLYLGVYPETSSDRRRKFVAGLLCGLAMSLRIQLAPAAVFAGLYFSRDTWKKNLPAVLAGALIPISIFGITDAVTWQHPFQSMYLYFWENAINGKSLQYGSAPWYWYIGELADHFGPLLIFALVGVRRSPFLGWIALIVLVSHSLLAHKESRFLYPVLPIVVVLSSIGLCEIVEKLSANIEKPWVAKTRILIVVTVFGAISMLFSFRFPYWSPASGGMTMFNKLSENKSACGVGLYSIPWYETGGYTYLHHSIPIIFVPNSEILSQEAPTFNTLVVRDGVSIPGSNFVLDDCRDDVCVYRRAGPCTHPDKYEINEVLRQSGG